MAINSTTPINQVAAAIALICESDLLELRAVGDRFEFHPTEATAFESKAKTLNKNFGRVMKWILFSTGAEYLIKGYFLHVGALSPEIKLKTRIPASGEIDYSWVARVNSQRDDTKENVNNYSTMRDLADRLAKTLKDLSQVDEKQAATAKAAYILLTDSIRNRDMHAYIKDVRTSHYHLIQEFSPAFNTLLGTLPINMLDEAVKTAKPTGWRLVISDSGTA